MTGRPTADIVADLRLNAIRPFLQQNVAVEQYVKDAADRLDELDEANRMGWKVATKLGDQLREIDEARPPCPTCGGKGRLLGSCNQMVTRTPCPDCIDGKAPIERLVKVFEAVHGDAVQRWNASSGIDPFDYLRGIR